MKVGFAQINTTVGDFEGNVAKILAAYRQLHAQGADVVLTPELALCGYPPLDLLLAPGFVAENLNHLRRLERELEEGTALVVGFVDTYPGAPGKPLRNAAAVLVSGQPRQVVYKSHLPMYDVFDERRYFEPAEAVRPINIFGNLLGITICEDIWISPYLAGTLYPTDPVKELVAGGAQSILNLSASPFQLGKPALRLRMLRELANQYQIPFFYCNAVGGNDQLIFDGYSFAVWPDGGQIFPGFQEELGVVDAQVPLKEKNFPCFDVCEDLFQALVLGVRDYMHKCGFRNCLLGLSGGIDSAVTACIAVEAVGAENVLGVALPGPYSSEGSVRDAQTLARNLKIKCLELPITESFEAIQRQMAKVFSDYPLDATEENFQSRLRGLTLMGLSNKFGSLLLSTGNKSELAVGYCTLYGDMCGGLAVISDVPKTLVYQLAHTINRSSEVIPRDTIHKAPSAELRPHQTDQDTLPPYEVLDAILQLYVEENLASSEIVMRGFDPKLVQWVLCKVDANEYKRKQAALGLKVTGRAFGMGRRLPMAQKYLA